MQLVAQDRVQVLGGCVPLECSAFCSSFYLTIDAAYINIYMLDTPGQPFQRIPHRC